MALHGVIPIVPTPFSPKGDVDIASLQRTVELAVEKGATVLAFLGMAGEGVCLSASERRFCLEVVAKAAAQRIPVFSGVNSCEPVEMVALATEARQHGIQDIMAMAAPRGPELAAAEILSLAHAIDEIRHIKDERVPSAGIGRWSGMARIPAHRLRPERCTFGRRSQLQSRRVPNCRHYRA